MEKRNEAVDWSVEAMISLGEQTTNVLREAILNETFKPGQKLVERTLAEQIGVSRTGVREALSKLQAEGLLTRVQGRGMYVSQLSESEARDSAPLRGVAGSDRHRDIRCRPA